MTFRPARSTPLRYARRIVPPLRTALVAAATAAATAAVLAVAGCGGGGQVQEFRASRVVAFGDESSVINANGSKYTVNGLASGSTTAFDCTVNPIWIQAVASFYGLAFPQCPGTTLVEASSLIFAAPGALATDVQAQVDRMVNSGGGFAPGDLVTVYAGVNDVIAQFQQYPAVSQDTLQDTLFQAGRQLALQINRIAATGAKVIAVTIPDVGLTPFAGDRSVNSTNAAPAILTALTKRFNDGLLSALLNDGHQIALVQLDQYVGSADYAARNGVSGAPYVDTTNPSCTVALPNCSTNTLVADAVNARWLWADDRHLSATAQTAFGSLAASRAHDNPF